jgi:hypothetical protein
MHMRGAAEPDMARLLLLLLLLLACCALETSAGNSLVSDLKDAAALFREGLLTAAEYDLAKQRLLQPQPPPLAPLQAAAPPPPPPLKTFGTGWSASVFNDTEQTIFEHSVPKGTVGVMTHFWITGMEQGHSSDPAATSWFNSNGTDNIIVRYYIDGEANASIGFKPPMAAGVGFSDGNADGDPTGMAHRLIGRAGMGGWYVNLKIPFGVSVRVTLTKDGLAGPYGWKQDPSFVIVRGCENLPVMVGAQTLPPTTRLRLHKIDGKIFEPLEWVPLLDLPSGRGLVLLVALAASSSSYQFWEGCVHMYSPYAQPFPGTLLATGTEDYVRDRDKREREQTNIVRCQCHYRWLFETILGREFTRTRRSSTRPSASTPGDSTARSPAAPTARAGCRRTSATAATRSASRPALRWRSAPTASTRRTRSPSATVSE